ncbi:hypothetical protein [Pseudarthrobacter sp. PS3-L1]|uniref:sunset domain-containing protein n=1 Tax=Pseudarthrobacter sp. PS3-L1 TaxID=3046207 RepID=UPI0024B9182C|nr:hypothetical protein [Pseudarthrobacter sp. PS3-L1]MDJ0321694.1 hypothetical protein [Pseudarthrobacter sp. PS3-L1]
MEIIILIIVVVLLIAVVWWVLNRRKSAGTAVHGESHARGEEQSTAPHSHGAVGGGGSTASSAVAAATTGIPGVAGFNIPADKNAPTTADDSTSTPSPTTFRHDELASDQQAAPATGTSPSGTSENVPVISSADQGSFEPSTDATGHADSGHTGASAAETATPAAENTAAPAQETTIPAAEPTQVDHDQWQTDWSQAAVPDAADEPGHDESGHHDKQVDEASAPPAGSSAAPGAHDGTYTGAHNPTLPGAESAAAETGPEATPESGSPDGSQAGSQSMADAEMKDRITSSASMEESATHDADVHAGTVTPEPTPVVESISVEPIVVDDITVTDAEASGGQPYGEGSATAAADGSGPEGYTVKADTTTMVYHDEDHNGFDSAHAEVWFLSPAHAEAAGFREPRRTRN